MLDLKDSIVKKLKAVTDVEERPVEFLTDISHRVRRRWTLTRRGAAEESRSDDYGEGILPTVDQEALATLPPADQENSRRCSNQGAPESHELLWQCGSRPGLIFDEVTMKSIWKNISISNYPPVSKDEVGNLPEDVEPTLPVCVQTKQGHPSDASRARVADGVPANHDER